MASEGSRWLLSTMAAGGFRTASERLPTASDGFRRLTTASERLPTASSPLRRYGESVVDLVSEEDLTMLVQDGEGTTGHIMAKHMEA